MRLRDRIFYDLTGGLWNRVLDARDLFIQGVSPGRSGYLKALAQGIKHYENSVRGVTRYGSVNRVDKQTRTKVERMLSKQP